jgi:hypothetical protein
VHNAFLERLAKGIQQVHRKLPQLVEKQNSPVGQGHLSGAGHAAAPADEGGKGCRVVRAAERRAI